MRPSFVEKASFRSQQKQALTRPPRLLKLLSSRVCYVAFVLSILIFTALTIAYKAAPDPWLQQPRFYYRLLDGSDAVQNSSLGDLDNSVSFTGSEFSNNKNNNASLREPLRISQEDIPGIADNFATRQGSCNRTYYPANCSDPDLKLVIEQYNLLRFPDLELYQILSSVRGSTEAECDVAWEYKQRNLTTTPLLMDEDFRRYTLSTNNDCTAVSVLTVGDWHSGVNAGSRPVKKSFLTATGEEGEADDGVVAGIVIMPLKEVVEKGVIDTVAAEKTSIGGGDPNNIFRHDSSRYLYYSRGADYCKSMSQYMWSLLCALGEARFLNRSFVMDLEICLPASNNPSHRDEPGKDFRFYFDYEHLQEVTSIIERQTFEKEREEWDTKKHPSESITELHVSDHHLKPAQLLNDTSIILYRDFVNEEESENYWYRVCEEDAESYIKRPWNSVWKSKQLMKIVIGICNKLDWNFDVVHVVRGEKASNKELWPNLESDTSSESLLKKFWDKIEEGRTIFIATDEVDLNYLHKLKADLKVRYDIFLLGDFEYLWARDSEWYTETKNLNAGQPVAFDAYMRAVIESELLYRGKKRIETFNDLTQDCENGDKSCKR